MKRSKKLTIGADIEVFVCAAPKPTRKRTRSKSGRWQKFIEQELDTLVPLDEAIVEDAAEPAGESAIPDPTTPAQIVDAEAALALIQKRLKPPTPAPSEILPCVGIFPGTKKEPYTPKGWPEGYAVQEDNVMLEFNIPPASTMQSFSGIIKHAHKLVNEICYKKGLKPVWTVPEHQFKPIQLTSPQAKMFACDPDLNAYTGGVQRDSVPNFGRYRTCGGHIHMGGDFQCPDFVAVLFLELALTMYFGQEFVVKPKSQRARWYGRPGVYREKPYGIEYRTLSNSWAANNYSTNDLGRVLFTLGEALISTPANVLQQWFRRIEWTLLHDILLQEQPTEKTAGDKVRKNQKDWQTLRQQYLSLKIPGLEL